MKIGFDAKRAFNNAAGLGNFSRNSISALSRQFPDDNFFLFHPGTKAPRFTSPENLREIRPSGIWAKGLKNVWRSFQISKLAKKLNLDIYHGLSHELPYGIEKSGVKTIVTIHDLIFLRYPEYFKPIDRIIYNLKFRHACRVADRIHAISEQTKRDIVTYFHVPEDKIEVIYQSINPVFFEKVEAEDKQEVRERYQLPEKFILTVGTVEPRKNLLNLLEGMVVAKIAVPLIVVGKPTGYKKKAEAYISENKELLNVIFLSAIQDQELAALHQMAGLTVYPSLFEGFGLPVAEAQACGCPVITSNTSSLPEAGGDAASYIDPNKPDEIGQAIRSVLNDEELRNSMILKGMINAQRFTPDNFALKINQLYKAVLND
jgi:glycosyltransferase involved in cell wall biosynthesis